MAVRAKDVAEYVLDQLGPMTAMKLQKLLYYSQAWHAVWEEEQLFPERIEAWAQGPVVPALYQEHKGRFRLEPGFFGGDPESLPPEAQESVEIVLRAYGAMDPQWLSDLTHMEAPWRDARRGLPDGARGDREITLEALVEYYSSLASGSEEA